MFLSILLCSFFYVFVAIFSQAMDLLIKCPAADLYVLDFSFIIIFSSI